MGNASSAQRAAQQALGKSCVQGDAEAAQLAIDAGADVNMPCFAHNGKILIPDADGGGQQIGATAAALAAHRGKIEVLQILLDANADPNKGHPGDKASPLHFACASGRTRAVQMLVAAGCDVNPSGADGMTPLMRAARWGHRDAIVALTKAGPALADVGRAMFVDLRAPVRRPGAVAAGRLDPDRGDAYGVRPLHWACAYGRAACVRALVCDAGADPNAGDKDGGTPAMYAAYCKNAACLAGLLAGGLSRPLDVNAVARGGGYKGKTALITGDYLAGKTALDVAVDRGAEEAADILRGLGGVRACDL